MDVFREPLLVCEILVSLQVCLLWENVYLPQLIDVVLDVMSFKSMSPQVIFFRKLGFSEIFLSRTLLIK